MSLNFIIAESKKEPTTVFIGGIAQTTTEGTLKQLFNKASDFRFLSGKG